MRLASLVIVLGVSLVASAAGTARALPPPQTVSIEIHETPGDASTPLRFTVSLDVTAIHGKDSSIAWAITTARFTEPGSSGRAWIVAAPTIATADNLWWVEHADVSAPAAADFRNLPALEGTALPMARTLEPLSYSLTFSASATSSGSQSLASYSFHTATTLIARTGDGEEEPVDIDIGTDT